MADSTLTTPSRRATLIGATVLAASAGLVATAQPASAVVHTQLYLDALAAYDGWLASCDLWGEMCPTHSDHNRLQILSDRAGDEYEAAFRKCCDFHVNAPSSVGIGEVCALWKIRCWHSPEGPDQMHDEFEIRALCQIIESVTGITAPEKLLAYT